ncbi:unnamed protein product [Phytophthora fragariaefolia]|uniref:Unnamed protein product n=1 Tax=Phytophthora fragariaefolia TaxID=1490495 RepID=A0A9W6UAD1_9STRA|nr:unnamed protein product [Phytophthora fragariaefolia]
MYLHDAASGLSAPAFEGIVQLPALPSRLVPSPVAQSEETPPAQPAVLQMPVRGKRAANSKAGAKGKGRKKAKVAAPPRAKRFIWTNTMVAALLDMRFGDEDVKKRVEAADTNLKKKLAWQLFAGRLSEALNVVLCGAQVLNKYKKLKCEYRQGKAARQQTGNDGHEEDTELWGILNSAFAARTGVVGAILADADDAIDPTDEDMSFASPDSKHKPAAPMTLADAMTEGMTAIAASLGSEDKLAGVLQELKESHEASQAL